MWLTPLHSVGPAGVSPPPESLSWSPLTLPKSQPGLGALFCWRISSSANLDHLYSPRVLSHIWCWSLHYTQTLEDGTFIHLCIPGILVTWDEVRIQQPSGNSLTYLLCTDSRQHNTKMNTRPGESGYLAPSYFGSQTAYLCYLHHLLMPLEGAHSLCLVSCLPYQHAELWRQLYWTSTAVQLFKNMRIQFGEYNQ